MAKEVLHVDFRPDREPSGGPGWRGQDILWTVLAVLGLLLLVAIAVELLPFLLVVLAVAAVLAGLSTWKAGRRQRILAQHGWPASPVDVRTYLAYLAGWFVGLLVIVPLLFFGALVAVVILAFVGVILIVGLIAGLLRMD